MKKKLVFVLAIIIFLFFDFQYGEESSIQVTEKPDFYYACMSFSGPYKNMGQNIMQFIGEFFKQGLQPQGALISVYHNSPALVAENELKWDIGFPIAADSAVSTPLKKELYEKKTVVEYLHRGSYEQFPEVYQKLQSYITENGYTIVPPSYEFYLNSPQNAKTEDLLTRIEIPVKKK